MLILRSTKCLKIKHQIKKKLIEHNLHLNKYIYYAYCTKYNDIIIVEIIYNKKKLIFKIGEPK